MNPLDLTKATASKSGAGYEVPGMRQFIKDLRAVDKALPKEIGKENKQIAEKVVSAAISKAQSLGSTAAKAAASGGIKSSARADAVTIQLGSNAVPYALGAEFGGGKRPTTRQFEEHLGRTGYFLYPTIRDKMDMVIEEYGKVVDRVAREAFPD